MRQLLTLLAILFCLFISRAQETKISMLVQSGLSIPAFEYSAKNLNTGSFALTGFTAGAEIDLTLKNNLGAFIQSGISLNPVDVGTLGYEKVQADPFLIDVYIRSDPFRVVNLMGGLLYHYDLTDKLNLTILACSGSFFSSTPYQLYKPEYFPIGPPYFEITSSNDISFAYGAGLRIVYMSNPWYQIGISSSFKRSKASFDFYSGNNLRTDIRQISIIELSLTLVLKLCEL